MDTVLDKAKLRLEAIEREADELRAFIRMYVRFSAADRMEPPNPSFGMRSQPAYRPATVPVRDGFSTRDEIVSAAREVLKTIAPRPMQIGDLYEALVDRGINISGKNPKGNLSAKLAPPEDIVYVRDEGWYYRPKRNEASAETSDANTGTAGGDPGVQNPNHGRTWQ